MYRLVIFVSFNFFLFFINTNSAISSDLKFKNIFFNAVEKIIINLDYLNSDMRPILNRWYNDNIKVNGIDGKLIITIEKYDEYLSKIDDGKKFEIFLKISTKILNTNNSFQKKEYFYEIKEFGKIQGSFSLNELDIFKQKIRRSVIYRLNNKIENS